MEPHLSRFAALGQFISFFYERLIKEETVVFSGDGGGGGSVPPLSQSRDRNAHKIQRNDCAALGARRRPTAVIYSGVGRDWFGQHQPSITTTDGGNDSHRGMNARFLAR